MRYKVIKRIVCFALLMGMAFSVLMPVSAAGADDSYIYSSWEECQVAPAGYACSGLFSYNFNSPLDMYCTEKEVYVLDSGNGQIVVFDENYTPVRVMDTFYTVSGSQRETTALNNPSGIFVSKEGMLLIADTGNARVLLCKPSGEIVTVMTKPQNESFPQELEFKPVNVVMDDLNNVYILSEGFYYGAVVYNIKGENTGFFGASKVKVTAALLADRFWRQFMNKKQLDYTKAYVPSSFASLDIDKNNFIYTCTRDSSDSIRKLNFLGSNIYTPEQGPDPLDKSVYGDRKIQTYNKSKYYTELCDIAVSENDFVFVLDSTKGRIFEYDQDSNLLNIFGGKGKQKGTFTKPCAIDTFGSDVLVLDQDKGAMYIFAPTDYGVLLEEATRLYQDGEFEKAYDKWEQVLKYNTNSELIYRGIGRAFLQEEKYTEAMKYARLGQDRLGYSKAFRFYRSEFVRSNFLWIIGIAVLVIAAFVVVKRVRKKLLKGTEVRSVVNVRDILFSPLTQYERLFSDRSNQPIIFSGIVVVLYFLAQVLTTVSTGFIFNKNSIDEFNVLFVLAQSVGLVVLWVTSDKVTGSFRFGHGTVRSIFIGTSAALVPHTIALYVNLVLSQVLTYEESAIMGTISTIGMIYTVYLLYQSVRVMQQYTVKEAIWAMLIDIVVAVVILLLLILVFMLMRQLFIFGLTIVNEVLYRM